MAIVGKKKHFWEYMGYDGKGEYGYCDRCKQYRYNEKKISKTEYLKRLKAKRIKGV